MPDTMSDVAYILVLMVYTGFNRTPILLSVEDTLHSLPRLAKYSIPSNRLRIPMIRQVNKEIKKDQPSYSRNVSLRAGFRRIVAVSE